MPVRAVLTILVGLSALLAAFSGRYGYHRDELYFGSPASTRPGDTSTSRH